MNIAPNMVGGDFQMGGATMINNAALQQLWGDMNIAPSMTAGNFVMGGATMINNAALQNLMMQDMNIMPTGFQNT